MPLDVRWPFPPADKITKFYKWRSKVTIAAVGIFAKVWAEWTNRIRVHNLETLQSAVSRRGSHRPLITVSNHKCCIDDPIIWGVLDWQSLVTRNDVMRWTVAASDISFTREWHSRFFSLGRVVPIVRGDGVYQRGMDFVIEKLNHGGWVHTFPEGGINMTNEEKRLKWGVGRLIAECTNIPLVIPLWHVGFETILPNYTPYIPRVGKKATLLVGEPIDFTEQLIQLRAARKSPREMRKAVTDVVQEEFSALQRRAEELHYNTHTETPSNTYCVTPSNTHSVTPSNTCCVTPSNTCCVTPSNTHSVTPSNTHSVTPSNTCCVTPSNTCCVTPSNTHSVTPSNTHSVTPNNTHGVTHSTSRGISHSNSDNMKLSNSHNVEDIHSDGRTSPERVKLTSSTDRVKLTSNTHKLSCS